VIPQEVVLPVVADVALAEVPRVVVVVEVAVPLAEAEAAAAVPEAA
jgi:hypothetical protein